MSPRASLDDLDNITFLDATGNRTTIPWSSSPAPFLCHKARFLWYSLSQGQKHFQSLQTDLSWTVFKNDICIHSVFKEVVKSYNISVHKILMYQNLPSNLELKEKKLLKSYLTCATYTLTVSYHNILL